jgi:multicomponent Na+:H+ antiporter subunit E
VSASVLVVGAMAVVWCFVRGEVSGGQFLLGSAFGIVFVLVTGAGRGRTVPLVQVPRRLFYLALFLLVLIPYGVLRANLQMARRLLHHHPPIRPAIIRMQEEEVAELTSAFEEHAITMTPGQMVVDYTPDDRTMYIHLIDVGQVEGGQPALWHWYRAVLEKIFS